jgi:hypothetical protein
MNKMSTKKLQTIFSKKIMKVLNINSDTPPYQENEKIQEKNKKICKITIHENTLSYEISTIQNLF